MPSMLRTKTKISKLSSGFPIIKVTQTFQQLNIDFTGPIPSPSGNKYMLTIIDEYLLFPFAFPCNDMDSKTVL